MTDLPPTHWFIRITQHNGGVHDLLTDDAGQYSRWLLDARIDPGTKVLFVAGFSFQDPPKT